MQLWLQHWRIPPAPRLLSFCCPHLPVSHCVLALSCSCSRQVQPQMNQSPECECDAHRGEGQVSFCSLYPSPSDLPPVVPHAGALCLPECLQLAQGENAFLRRDALCSNLCRSGRVTPEECSKHQAQSPVAALVVPLLAQRTRDGM